MYIHIRDECAVFDAFDMGSDGMAPNDEGDEEATFVVEKDCSKLELNSEGATLDGSGISIAAC
jgi:hypothetical protein